ncbi:MAG: FeoC-like transcriptional regulator [Anaerolineae bacterium]
MLEQLLQQISRAQGAVALPQLARALGVAEAQIEPMLETLERLGYLEQVQPACPSTACSACGHAQGCTPASRIRLWQLTQRGLERRFQR